MDVRRNDIKRRVKRRVDDRLAAEMPGPITVASSSAVQEHLTMEAGGEAGGVYFLIEAALGAAPAIERIGEKGRQVTELGFVVGRIGPGGGQRSVATGDGSDFRRRR